MFLLNLAILVLLPSLVISIGQNGKVSLIQSNVGNYFGVNVTIGAPGNIYTYNKLKVLCYYRPKFIIGLESVFF